MTKSRELLVTVPGGLYVRTWWRTMTRPPSFCRVLSSWRQRGEKEVLQSRYRMT